MHIAKLRVAYMLNNKRISGKLRSWRKGSDKTFLVDC